MPILPTDLSGREPAMSPVSSVSPSWIPETSPSRSTGLHRAIIPVLISFLFATAHTNSRKTREKKRFCKGTRATYCKISANA